MSGFGIRRCCCAAAGNFNLCRLAATGSPPATEWKSLIGSTNLFRAMIPDGTATLYVKPYDTSDYDLHYVVNSSGTLTSTVNLSLSLSNHVETRWDSSGNVYMRFIESSVDYLAKYNSSGTEVWKTTLGSGESADQMEVDASGNIVLIDYEVGSSGPGGIRYFNSSGVFQWSQNPIVDGFGNCRLRWAHFDSSGNIYAVADTIDSSGDFLIKLNSSGTEQWRYPTDPSGYSGVFNVGFASSYARNRSENTYLTLFGAKTGWEKINGSGSMVYDSTPSDSQALTAFAQVDSSENFYYAIPNADTTINSIKKYQSDGTLVWAKTTDIPIRISALGALAIQIDSSDQLWVAGGQTSI